MAICYDTIDIKNIKEAYLVFPFEINLPFKAFLLASFTDININNNAVVVSVLPEDVSISSSQRDHKNGVYWNNSIAFSVPSQTPENYVAFNKFNNSSVVVVFKTESKAYMYGNSMEPLRFYISELNTKKLSGITGYKISLKGKTTFESKHIPISDFYQNNYLASLLATDL